MKKRKYQSLWWYFVSLVFLIMLSSSLIMTPLTIILFRSGYISLDHKNPIIPILSLFMFSLVIGTIITIMVGKKILSPITNFNRATKEIAKGNFDIEMNESHRINEISEMAQHFNRMVQELRSIETLRNDFVVNVSHEFKTPLAAIEGYAMLLQDKSITEEEHDEYTRMIMDSARQLSALSGNILKISKLENQEVITEKAQYRLDEQLRQALLLLEPHWSSKKIILDILLEKQLFYGNEELMIQVWLNLIDNAIKFTPENREISVHLLSDPGFITVIISDTGIGMTKGVRKHIFEKFYQGDKTRSAEGNGLGLALVRRIIDLCDGTIEVESEIGEGSTFRVKLPK